MIDPAPFGDPEAIRALAQEIAARADIVGDTPTGFATALDAAVFEGGAATRLRAAAVDTRRRAVDLSAEIRDIAAALFADAATVETENADAVASASAAAAAGGGGQPPPADGTASL
jgi:hypothetical protein